MEMVKTRGHSFNDRHLGDQVWKLERRAANCKANCKSSSVDRQATLFAWLRSKFCKPETSLLKKVAAEFVGTFILIFGAVATPIVNDKYDGAETLIGKAASAGLAVTIVVLSIGHISGAHLNPSVSIALAALRHFPLAHVPAYIAAQLLGSICASFALKFIFYPLDSGGVTVPSITTPRAFFLEFIVSYILLFVITAVATDARAVGKLAGIAIGATVLMNILIAGPSTGGSMNPARTLGPAIATRNYKKIWIYFVAPTLGGIAGTASYDLMKLEE